MIENGYVERVATAHAIREYQQPNLFLAIFRDDHLLDANHNQNEGSPSVDKHPAATAQRDFLSRAIARRDPILTTTAADGQDEWRVVAYAPGGEEAEYVIVVAESRRDLIDQMRALRGIFLLSLPAMLLVAGFAGYLLARKSLAPIAEMTAQAERISAESLHEGLPVKNKNDELGRLARVFNDLLARIEARSTACGSLPPTRRMNCGRRWRSFAERPTWRFRRNGSRANIARRWRSFRTRRDSSQASSKTCCRWRAPTPDSAGSNWKSFTSTT